DFISSSCSSRRTEDGSRSKASRNTAARSASPFHRPKKSDVAMPPMPAPERRPDSNGERSPGSRHRAGWFGRWLLRMLNVIAVASLVAAPAASWPATAHESEAAVGAPDPFQPYVVHLAEPNALVEGNAPAADLVARAHQHQRDEIGSALDT